MKMIKKTIKATLALILAGSAVFAQNVADAKKAIDAEQYQKAKGILKNLIKAKPSDAESYFYLGNVYLKTDYIDSAKATFDQGIKADADFALNYVGLGSVDLQNKNAAAAKTNFEKAQSLVKKKDIGPALYTGKAYILAKDFDAALNYLENPSNPAAAAVKNQKDQEVFVPIGDAYRDRGKGNGTDLTSAYKAYQTALTLDKSLVRAQLELAIIAKRAFAWSEAIDQFNKIIQANPNYAPAYRELAETYLYWARADAAKDYDAHIKLGLENYEKYMSLTDQSLESRIRHADFLVYAKAWKELQAEATEMLKIAGTDARVLRYQGFAAYQNKDYSTAEQALDQWISKADPKRLVPEDYLFRGQAKVSVALAAKDSLKIKTGLEDLQKAVVLDSTNAEAVEDVAKAIMDEKYYDMAADAYEIATKNPSIAKQAYNYYFTGYNNYLHFAIKYSRDSVNRDQGKPYLVKADTAFGSFLKLSPTSIEGYYWRAKIAKEMDDQKAPTGLILPYWEKYIAAVAPKTDQSATEKAHLIEAYKSLAFFYIPSMTTLNDPALPVDQKVASLTKSEEYFGKVLSIDPNDAYSKSMMDTFSNIKAQLTAPPPPAKGGTKSDAGSSGPSAK
jgi:tetratricopeptide (TPR) repeat protein